MAAAKLTGQVQEMIQTALAAQATIHQKEFESKERALVKDFNERLLQATAVKTPPGSPTSSTCLNMGSSVIGGKSTSAISKAAVSRASALVASASSLRRGPPPCLSYNNKKKKIYYSTSGGVLLYHHAQLSRQYCYYYYTSTIILTTTVATAYY